MRAVGNITGAIEAQRFVDHLLTLGVGAEVTADGGSWVVWVHDDGDVESATAALAGFLDDPQAAQYLSGETAAAELRAEDERSETRWRKRNVDMAQKFRSASRQPLTMALIGLSVAVFVISGFGENLNPFLNWLTIARITVHGNQIRWFGLSEIMSGQLWRLVTPIFIHFGLIHLAFNMLWLHSLGSAIEGRRGRLRFLAIVLAIGVVSNLGEYAWNGPYFGGMSGVVYGLLGYVWMKGKYDSGSGLFVDRTTATIMLVWLFLCMTGIFGSVANGAHVVGLLAGLAIGGVPHLRPGRRSKF